MSNKRRWSTIAGAADAGAAADGSAGIGEAKSLANSVASAWASASLANAGHVLPSSVWTCSHGARTARNRAWVLVGNTLRADGHVSSIDHGTAGAPGAASKAPHAPVQCRPQLLDEYS